MKNFNLEHSDYQHTIAKEFVNNILNLTNGEDLYSFWKLEKDQTEYLIGLLSLDEDGEIIREDVFKAIDILNLKFANLKSVCNDLGIKTKKPLLGIEELKKEIEMNDPILKWKERKKITTHDWAIKTTDFAFAQINDQTMNCELAGSFLNDAINLIQDKVAIENIENAKRIIYKLLRHFELQGNQANDYLNDELNKPDEPIQ